MKRGIVIVLAPAQEMELGFERHELMATPHWPIKSAGTLSWLRLIAGLPDTLAFNST